MPAPAPPRAVIAGGGLVGGTAALALRQAGMDVTICDPAPGAAPTRSYSLNLASVRMLGALDLWDDLAPHAGPILDIYVSDARPGRGASRMALHFDHRGLGAPMGHMIEERHLRPALDAALGAAGVERRAQPVTGHVEHDASLSVATPEGALEAALLVGCDGRTGPLAARAGIGRSVKRYRQTGLVAVAGIERPHRGAAHQMFLPAGPLALLPLKGDRLGVVWTEAEAEAARIAALDDAAFEAHLRRVVGPLYGALTLEGGRGAYPLTRVLADRYAAGRVVLAGDAAHGVHPIAGQGLNAGLKDAAALAECVLEARRIGADPGVHAPPAYERWRRFDAAALALATDGVNALFSNAAAGPRLLRGLGLGAANALPGLKRRLVREAAGLTGEVPRLMRGEALGPAEG